MFTNLGEVFEGSLVAAKGEEDSIEVWTEWIDSPNDYACL